MSLSPIQLLVPQFPSRESGVSATVPEDGTPRLPKSKDLLPDNQFDSVLQTASRGDDSAPSRRSDNTKSRNAEPRVDVRDTSPREPVRRDSFAREVSPREFDARDAAPRGADVSDVGRIPDSNAGLSSRGGSAVNQGSDVAMSQQGEAASSPQEWADLLQSQPGMSDSAIVKTLLALQDGGQRKAKEEEKNAAVASATAVTTTVGRIPAQSVSATPAQTFSIHELLSPAAKMIAESVALENKMNGGRLSPIQGGLSQSSLAAEMEEVRQGLNLRAEPGLISMSQLIEDRSGLMKAPEALDKMVDILMKRASDEDIKQFEDVLAKAELHVDFEKGVIQDLHRDEAQSGAVLLTDIIRQLEESAASAAGGAPAASPAAIVALKGAPQAMLERDADITEGAQPLGKDTAVRASQASKGFVPFSPARAVDETGKESLANDFSANSQGHDAMAQLAASHADKGFHQATLKEVAPTAVGATQAAQGTSHLVDSQQTTLIRSVQTLVHQGGGEMVIQLQPRELGEVHIRVSQEQGAIHIQAQAERVEVAQAIRNDLPQILSRLDERGITVAGMDVKIMGSDATSTRTERFQSGTGSGEFTHSQDSFFNQRFDDQQREAFRQRRERFYDTMELVA